MIQVSELYFSYPGNNSETLKDLTFQVADGEIFGFLGPSGAGKSTTQKILIGILKNYQGFVQVNGQDLKHLSSDFYETIGVAFETANLYSKFTALENLKFFSQFYAGETRDPRELLAAVGLLEAADTRISDFSKGMKVRLNFCRSLLNNPRLLFLDEPTAGLDPVNLRLIMGLIQAEQKRGTTICLTTHDMHVAEGLCDRVAFIVEGQVKLIDSPRELKIKHGVRHLEVEYTRARITEKQTFSLEDLGNNRDFQKLLQKYPLETMHSKEATLEDVFVKTTGRKLR